MSIWSFDIIRADGNLFAYTRIQDDYTGNITGKFFRVRMEGFDYYFRADGKRNICTRQVAALLASEDNIKQEHEFYKKYRGFIHG